MRNHFDDGKFYQRAQRDATSNRIWAYLAYQRYHLQMKDLQSLSDYLSARLEEDFMELYNQADQIIREK